MTYQLLNQLIPWMLFLILYHSLSSTYQVPNPKISPSVTLTSSTQILPDIRVILLKPAPKQPKMSTEKGSIKRG